MEFATPLVRGTLLKRYKRFLADIELADGTTLTAHCPNTGSMLSCSTPGSEVALSVSDNPKRKYPHTLEMVKDNKVWVGVNTSRTNKLVEEAILAGKIEEFKDVEKIAREVKTSDHTRLDLKVTNSSEDVFIEVKNCSLANNNVAMFPDAVTARGTKHLLELQRLQEERIKSCIFFLVQRMDAGSFTPAAHIDSLYAETLREVMKKGVMVLVHQAEVSPEKIEVVRSLPVKV